MCVFFFLRDWEQVPRVQQQALPPLSRVVTKLVGVKSNARASEPCALPCPGLNEGRMAIFGVSEVFVVLQVVWAFGIQQRTKTSNLRYADVTLWSCNEHDVHPRGAVTANPQVRLIDQNEKHHTSELRKDRTSVGRRVGCVLSSKKNNGENLGHGTWTKVSRRGPRVPIVWKIALAGDEFFNFSELWFGKRVTPRSVGWW